METNSFGHLLDEFVPGASTLLSFEKAPPVILIFVVAVIFGKLMKNSPFVANEKIPALIVALSSVLFPAMKGWNAANILVGFSTGAVATFGHKAVYKAIRSKLVSVETDFIIRKPFLLIIDDDAFFCELARHGLPCCHVTYCTTVKCAFDLLESGYRPDAVIVDLLLPGSSGVDVINSIKARFSVPCLLISGSHPRPEQQNHMLDSCGAIHFMIKPIRITESFWSDIRVQLRIPMPQKHQPTG